MANGAEALIQLALWRHFNELKHVMICPNVTTTFGEADLLTRTRTGLLHEIEIKNSLADFGAEFRARRKQYKHFMMSAMVDIPNPDRKQSRGAPNYYWFAVPCCLTKQILDRLPAYAGLIVIDTDEYNDGSDMRFIHPLPPGGVAVVVHPAPRLHRNKATDYQVYNMARSVMNHYWYRETGDKNSNKKGVSYASSQDEEKGQGNQRSA